MQIEKYLNKIHCCDCLEFMKKLPDNCVDLVLTSPPYNIGNNCCAKKKYFNSKNKDLMSKKDYLLFLSNTLLELIRITKNNIFFNIQSLSYNKINIIELLFRFKDYFKDKIVWIKNNPPPAIENGVMTSKFEDIYIFSKDNPNKRKFYYHNFCNNIVHNVIIGNSASCEKFKNNFHKAAFPLYLPEKIIYQFSKRNDIILDCFGGIGTVGVACERLNRKYILIEKEPYYCDIANARIEAERRQLKLPISI